ncbi:hypothetical protein EVAR_62109_1 [Eumeta japonica]|uniref:Uncharacterized protein n=1 Tax=Eumeta variegata TaxID=151549 RepID=A0A4C1Z1T6_EUMVA|nr:hypothetical protein EVAR_62109_1 [Eumeta japonica]
MKNGSTRLRTSFSRDRTAAPTRRRGRRAAAVNRKRRRPSYTSDLKGPVAKFRRPAAAGHVLPAYADGRRHSRVVLFPKFSFRTCVNDRSPRPQRVRVSNLVSGCER